MLLDISGYLLEILQHLRYQKCYVATNRWYEWRIVAQHVLDANTITDGEQRTWPKLFRVYRDDGDLISTASFFRYESLVRDDQTHYSSISVDFCLKHSLVFSPMPFVKLSIEMRTCPLIVTGHFTIGF